jgi:hypothetical protein
MQINSEYFWIVLCSGDLVWAGDCERTARAIAEANEWFEVQECCKCG